MQALIVLGRLARAGDLDRVEEAFVRAHALAEQHALTIWRCRALHELGTIDMFRECSPRRLLEARKLADDLGALATVASDDIELTAVHALRFELEQSLESARRALKAGRRYRLMRVESIALLFIAELHGLRQDRPAMERLLAELPAVGGEEAAYFDMCRTRSARRRRCARTIASRHCGDLATSIGLGRCLAAGAPSPMFGEWTLLWTLEQPHGVEAEAKAPPDWAMVQPINRAFVHYAAAVTFGVRGQVPQASEAVAQGDELLANAPWYLHMGRRLIAEAAIRGSWGDPAVWLPESERFFDLHGYQAVASACRSLLRLCGVRSTTGRGHAGVPEPFGALGVTQREMEVLAVLPDGLSNKESAARVYLSTKTVEKHIAGLMDKLDVRSRAQLAAITAAKMGGTALSNWGNSRL